VTCAVAAALAALVMAIAAGVSHLSQPASSTGVPVAALQIPAVASPAAVAASSRIGAREQRFWAVHRAAAVVTRSREQALQASFSPRGVDLQVPGGTVGMSLVAVGHGRRLTGVPEPTPTSLANVVSYERGPLTEWYANGPVGLEQSVMLDRRPQPSHGRWLTFAYQLSGVGSASLEANELVFRTPSGAPLLGYGGLEATDAFGRKLRSRLMLAGDRLLIEVQDAHARYPITADPIFEAARLNFLARTFSISPNRVAEITPTGPTLSIIPLGTGGGSWDEKDEGNTSTEALMEIKVPSAYGQVTNVTPGQVVVTPNTSLQAVGIQSPPTPSGGFTVAAGGQLNYSIPYKVLGSGNVTLGSQFTWKDSGGTLRGPATAQTTILLGYALTGTITLSGSGNNPAVGVTVTVKGTQSASGAAVTKTAVTNAQGQYTFNLGPGTYQVTPATDLGPTAVGSADCAASHFTCTVSMSQDRVANFTVACQPTLDFHTSMVATGCFEPIDYSKGTWKAVGLFRMDGVDYESPDDVKNPVVFDDQNKTVNGDSVKLSLSAEGYGSGWLAFYVPGGLHLSFANTTTTVSWALSTPWSTPHLYSVIGLGFLAAGSGSSSTLFGFPAHAPAFEFNFTSGQTVFTGQLSFPSNASASLDPINGLWKVNGRVSYPTAVKVSITANNSAGVTSIAGSFSPAGVIAINSLTNSDVPSYTAPGTAPKTAAIELAKIGFNWLLQQGVFHTIGVFVIHSSTASGKAKDFIAPLGGFLGRTLVTTDASWRWLTSIDLLGHNIPLPGIVGLGVQVNNINEYIPDTPGLFWQRAGFQILADQAAPADGYKFGANVGFTWGPRFKHDLLWFQELLSLDGSGTISFDPGAFEGSADLKAANATVLHGALKMSAAGVYLEGSVGFDINQVLRSWPFKSVIQGTGKLSIPFDPGESFALEITGKQQLWSLGADVRLIITNTGGGECATAKAFGHTKTQGVYYDGQWHIGGCNGGPFNTAISAGALTSAPSGGDTRGGKDAADVSAVAKLAAVAQTFTIKAHSHVAAVSVHGATGPPQLLLTGPGGLHLKVTKASPTAFGSAAGMVMNSSDDRTYILFTHAPAPGVYHLKPLPGSPAIRWVDFSQPLPPVSVHGKLRSKGCQQQLRWNARPEPGQTITIVDRSGNSQIPLATSSGSGGKLTFTPNPAATSAQQIVAVVSQQGTPRAEVVLARFKAPNGPGRVTRLRAHHSKISWSPVCAASYYYATAGSGTSKQILTTKATKLTIPGKGRRKVSVRTVNARGQAGKPASITLH
jgi:hypothetical protein